MQNRTTHPWLVLVLVCLAQFMVVLDATVVNVALPSIQNDLDMSESDLQWVVNAYTLVFGGFLLLGGRAGDLIGRKRVFLAGVVRAPAQTAPRRDPDRRAGRRRNLTGRPRRSLGMRHSRS